MKKETRRYIVAESKGGSPKRYFVWDLQKHRMVKGILDKYDAVGLEHKLNDCKFKLSIL